MAVRPEQIKLSPLGKHDLSLVLAWRNDPEVMQYLPSAKRPLTWEEHFAWYERYDDRNLREDWTIDLTDGRETRSVGTVHYVNFTSEIGLLVGEKTLWGQGVGRIALEQALRRVSTPQYENLRKEIGPIWAVVHPENLPSVQLFESLNFVAAGEGRNGQIKFVWQGWKA